MVRKVIVDGNEACANVAYMFSEICSIYPITPSSNMASHVDKWSAQGRLNIFKDQVKVVEMQSEAGAIGMMHGSLQAGSLTSTFTASQGLLLMIPNMYKIAGELLPGVIHVAARSIATHALSILGDHQDVYATRQTGFALLGSASVEEASDFAGIAHLASIKSSIPFLHFFDGFRTSHELNKVEVLDIKDYKKLIDKNKVDEFRDRALNINNPVTRGTNQNDDIYFQNTEARNKFYLQVPEIVNQYMEEINKIKKTDYQPFNYYGHSEADKIIIAMGSVCGTIIETIETLNKQDYKVGLIKVNLYRPFSKEYLEKVLPRTVTDIAVLDRTKEPGSVGEPLYLDVVSCLKHKNIRIGGGRYGLSSKNTTPAHIKAVYDYLNSNDLRTFTVGIKDDVTYLSLPIDKKFKLENNNIEFKIFGYGSDGMVSAAADIVKILGSEEDIYVQGYSQYDSKKSGGLTRSHLRFGNEKIKSTYYVENPNLVVVTKDSYLKKFDVLENIKENGLLLVNTNVSEEEFIKCLPYQIKKTIKDKKIQTYLIDAEEISNSHGLKNKISVIMEAVIFKLTADGKYDYFKGKIINNLKKRFCDEKIVEANIESLNNLNEKILKLKDLELKEEEVVSKKMSAPEMMLRLKGDDIPVSAFLGKADGTFDSGIVQKEKSGHATTVPTWIKENCIQCNKCVSVCPHAAIRSYLIDEDEQDDLLNGKTLKALGTDVKNLNFMISVSPMDCTSCGLCESVCPVKNKALVMKDFHEEETKQEVFDYLEENVMDKDIEITNVKTAQFKKPKFEFSGACPGCGETPYLTMLTRLFGGNMIIANATGCSSIYGGSLPFTTYSVPWINSLFEDNAEFGYGISVSQNNLRNRILREMKRTVEKVKPGNRKWYKKYINNFNDYEATKEVYTRLDYEDVSKEILKLKNYITKRSTWVIGGDGFAYDIGFGGLDHVLSTNEDINVLVLNTEVYSNTGGQSSKASKKGSVAEFTVDGKKYHHKDLALMALNYPHVYVAHVNMMHDSEHYLKVLKEAESYNGPSLIIAYCPCIAHGIKGGMTNSIKEGDLATRCGYFPIFKYNPTNNQFVLEDKKVDFKLYDNFLKGETRYNHLFNVNKKDAKKMLADNKKEALRRFNIYKDLAEASNKNKES